MRGIFITGTGTGVGKTYVTCALLRALRQQGVDAAPMKPFQTGALRDGATLHAPDLEEALDAAGLRPTAEELPLMVPFLYEPACSPHLAARLIGVVEPDASMPSLTEQVMERVEALLARHEFLVVEGAGGVLVPLSTHETMRDLMAGLGFPVLVVAQAGLGTLNHTLLTLEALRRVGIQVLGVLLNEAGPDAPEYIVEDNLEYLRQRGSVPVLGLIRNEEKAPAVMEMLALDIAARCKAFSPIA